MQLLSVASYCGSGSSAVTDLISEYKNVKSLTNYEFRFAHDPDGLSELEYNLVENFNRHNSGHAIKRYKDLVDYNTAHLFMPRYEPFFGGKWKKISYQYIDSLVDFSYPGSWLYDFYDKGPWYEFWSLLPNRIMHVTLWRNKPDNQLLFNKEITYASRLNEEEFLERTRKYTDMLMEAANPEKKEYIMLDQIVPSSNIERHMRYFNNLKVFVVDRDPRDIFLIAKYIWHESMIPGDVDLFCKWFKYARSTKGIEKWDPGKIMTVQFEDLIYKYEETKNKIISWAGLDEKDHVYPKKYLDPDVSIKNTRLWEQRPQYKEEADFIAKELPEYLYCAEQ